MRENVSIDLLRDKAAITERDPGSNCARPAVSHVIQIVLRVLKLTCPERVPGRLRGVHSIYTAPLPLALTRRPRAAHNDVIPRGILLTQMQLSWQRVSVRLAI